MNRESSVGGFASSFREIARHVSIVVHLEGVFTTTLIEKGVVKKMNTAPEALGSKTCRI